MNITHSVIISSAAVNSPDVLIAVGNDNRGRFSNYPVCSVFLQFPIFFLIFIFSSFLLFFIFMRGIFCTFYLI